MTRKKFSELASAYVDGELSDRDRARLEEAAARNPEYARILDAYLKMNCALASVRFPELSKSENPSFFGGTVWRWGMPGAFAGIAAAMAVTFLTGGVEPLQPGREPVVELTASESPIVEAASSAGRKMSNLFHPVRTKPFSPQCAFALCAAGSDAPHSVRRGLFSVEMARNPSFEMASDYCVADESRVLDIQDSVLQ